MPFGIRYMYTYTRTDTCIRFANQHRLSRGTKYFFNRSAGFFILPRHHTPFCVAVAHVTRLFRRDGFRFGQQSWLWSAVTHKSLWRALRKWSRMCVCLRRCALLLIWSKRVRTAAGAAAAAVSHFYKTQVMPSDYLMKQSHKNKQINKQHILVHPQPCMFKQTTQARKRPPVCFTAW